MAESGEKGNGNDALKNVYLIVGRNPQNLKGNLKSA